MGQYYLGTEADVKTIPISFAFDGLTENQLRVLKETFNGFGIHELIFDEDPYKVYSAKVTESASIKTVCFEVNGQREYRGEGSLQFTCYYPYAHSRHSLPTQGTQVTAVSKKFNCGIVVESRSTPSFSNDTLSITYLTESGDTGKITKTNEGYIVPGKAGEYVYLLSIEANKEIDAPTITINGKTYHYTDKNCYETTETELSGKVINHYSSTDFSNKFQWARASGLPLFAEISPLDVNNINNTDKGDVPGSFTLSIVGNSPLSGKYKFSWGTLGFEAITTNNLFWDSKTGLVYNQEAIPELIEHSGNTVGTIPFSQSSVLKKWNEVSGAYEEVNSGDYTITINYDYWYY